MSDDEPDWLVAQGSAQKERREASRRSSSSDISLLDFVDSDAEPAPSQEKKKRAKEPKEKKRRATPSSRLPLLLAPKVRRDMMLVEADDPTLDLSGDFGCIGRLHVRKSGRPSAVAATAERQGGVAEVTRTVMLDLKGKLYDGDIVPCQTVCLLSIDSSKAQVEAVFSDFLQLDAPRDSIFDNEAVKSGELGVDFFDDDDGNVNSGGESEEEVGPLKEGKAKTKGPAKGKPRSRGKRKSKGSRAGAAKSSGSGVKRKLPSAASSNKRGKDS